MNTDVCRRYRVHGVVQGVYFRAAARDAARAYGLQGWVRNLADGSVEACARGTPQALAAFERWLHQGPPRARVTAVDVMADDGADMTSGFIVR
jgi:acylphosphatase